MFSKFSMRQEVFNAFDTVIKIVGIFALIISGFFAVSQFREGQEREYKKVFYEKQVGVISNLFEVMTEMDIVSSQDEKDKAAKKFWMIYQGSGRAFLSPNMFESLKGLPVDYVRGCVAKISKPAIISDCRYFSASQSMAGFAKVAREEIAKNWAQDFSKIGSEDPWIKEKR